ncbi:hypothetical protein [Rubinisphaera margarita]|uniref:hypothetical protein n=1 Tax=Rubinisphaera margarita TaxID=2909586 RepID=UPI001EE89D9D|nr:hypothetical protein [Rubinisphaera margarita]MCG6154701.1 hypothetical protein [Rubinisphaera margarita]
MFSSVQESPLTHSVKSVADLTMDQIRAMERSELIQVIQQGRVPFLEHDRLGSHDTSTLQQLALLSRESCTHQV